MKIYRSYFLLGLVLIGVLSAQGNYIYGQPVAKYEPDKNFISAGINKGKELGHNPIAVFIEKEKGNLMIAGGQFFLDGGQVRFRENDMVINVGELPIEGPGFTLLKGEYFIVMDGKFLKQDGKIITTTQ